MAPQHGVQEELLSGNRAARPQWISTLLLPTKRPRVLALEEQGTSCCLSRYGKTMSIPSQLAALNQHSQPPSSGYRQDTGAGKC